MEFLSDLIAKKVDTLAHVSGQRYLKIDSIGKVFGTTDVQETDPTVPSWVKAITSGEINQWNQAFGWGNHAGLYVPLSGASFIQSTGRSSSWGSTNGTSTGAFNAIMGTSASATWLLSGTKNGVFMAGIQALDADGSLRFYQGTNFFSFTNNTITATGFTGALTGNATTATTLQTARTINGTSFNGSANITTALWGTARTITIGGSGRSVDGSANISWTLAEIGAAATSHAHSNLTPGTGISGSVYNGGTAQTWSFDTTWGDARYQAVGSYLNLAVGGVYANNSSHDLNTWIGGTTGLVANSALNSPINSPSGFHWVVTQNQYGGNTTDLIQLAYPFRDAGFIQWRTLNSAGNWSSWYQVWDSKNFDPTSKANVLHTHVINDVTGLQTALDGKQPLGSYAATSHTHTWSNITDAPTKISLAELNAGTLTTDRLVDAKNLNDWLTGKLSGSSGYTEELFTFSTVSTFTLAQGSPMAISVFHNGQRLVPALDYTVSGNQITVTALLNAGDEILVTYFFSIVGVSLSGSGTIGYIPKWSSASGLSNSILQESGTNLLISGNTAWHSGNFNPSGYQPIGSYADQADSVFYLEGNTTGTAGTWTASNPKIASYYDGLTVSFKIGIAGAATTTLNINGLGARTVRRNNANMTTHLPVGTVVLLTYTTISSVGYFVWADYDVNTTYSEVTDAELQSPASTTARLITGRRIDAWATWKGLSDLNISNWNTAYGWGNHAGLYRLSSYVPSWSEITGKPTTLAGYGITDAQGFITAGTTAQYYRGDKTWQTLNTASVPESGNLYFTEARVRSTVLTGLGAGSNTAITATDSLLTAFANLQNQINNRATSSHSHAASSITAGTFGAGGYVFPGILGITGQSYQVAIINKGNSGTGTVTFNWNDGNIQLVTLTGNCTFAFSNPQVSSYQIKIVQDATGSRSITWPTGIHWAGKSVPSLTGTPNSVDWITITYDGSVYSAVISKNHGV